MQDGPWNKYRQQAPQAPQQQVPDRIYGAPAAADPAEEERLRLARAADARSAAAAAREASNFAQQERNRAATGGVDFSVEQGKAAGFLRRAEGAESKFSQLNVGPRGYFEEVIADAAPKFANAFLDDDTRKSAKALQDEFIAATLRYESGAAIPPAEMEAQRSRYFPVPGDGPQQLVLKAQLRKEAIQALRDSAGPAGTLVAAPDRGNMQVVFGDEQKPVTGYRLTPDQEAQILQAIRDGDRGQVLALFERFSGVAPGAETVQSVENAIDTARRGGTVGLNYGAVDRAAQEQADVERFGSNLAPAIEARQRGSSVDALVRGVADTASFGLADELSAAATTLFGGGTMRENLQRERAIDEADRRVNAGERFAGQLGGAILNPIGRNVSTVTEAARAGGAAGALYGFGSGENLQQRGTNALLTGAGGAVAGAAVQGAVNVLSPFARRIAERGGRGEARAAEMATARDAAAAAEAEGVSVSRGILDPQSRNRLTYLETTRAGAPIVQRGMQRTADDIEGRLGQMSEAGTSLTTQEAGETIQGAGRRFIDTTGKRATRLYDRARELSGDTRVQPARALGRIDETIASLRESGENSNAPLIGYLEGLRADLSREGGLSIQAIRDLRTNMRGQIDSRNLTQTNAERLVGDVLDSASADIEAALSNNPAAVNAFRQADKFYRERMAYIDDVVRNMLGNNKNPLSAEKAFARLTSMTRSNGDARRLAEIMKSASPDEARNIAATFASSLGRDAAGEFSPTLFVTQAERMSPSARRILFGEDGARSVENLMKVSREWRATAKNLNNSRTAVATNYRGWLGNVLGLAGAAAGLTAGSGATGAAVAAIAAKGATDIAQRVSDRISAKALMSPDITKWLANAPSTTSPRAIDAHLRRLANVAARNPLLAGEVATIQQRLISAIQQMPQNAAASRPNAEEPVRQNGEEIPQR